jgi:hypothetical protein
MSQELQCQIDNDLLECLQSYEHADSPAIRLWDDATHAMTLNEKVGIHAH